MQASLSDKAVDTVKKIFKILKEIVENVNIAVTEDGWEINCMDGSFTRLIVLKIEQETAFNQYFIKKDQVIGINCKAFWQLLCKISDTNEATFSTFGDSSSTTDIAYEISVSFTTNSGQYYVYTMKLLDLDNQLLDPKVSSEPDCELVIPTAEWDNIMKNVASMGESLRVICNETLNIEAHGLGGAGKTQIGGKLKEDKKLTIRSPFTQEFAVKLLVPLSAVSVADTLTIHWSAATPMLFRYEITLFGTFDIWCAPKIE